MKKSPKTVRIDLLAESKKRSKSPSPNNLKSSTSKPNSHQFSFSHQSSPFLQSKSKERQKREVARKLFSGSPEKVINKKKTLQKPKTPKYQLKQRVPHKYYSDKNQRFQKKIGQYELLKRPLDNLKRTFFSSIRDNKEQTIRTLKEIGRYAQQRSKQKLKNDHLQSQNSQKRKKPISVQFYGFQPLDQRPYSPSKQRKTQTQETSDNFGYNEPNKYKAAIDQGTYFNFQNQFNKHLEYEQSFPRVDLDNPTIRYSSSPQKYITNYQTSNIPTGIENINEIQIDGICQIFEMCQKYEQGQRLVLSEFYLLLEQFQRLYFIKIIQQSEANGLPKQKIKINESGFYQLLKRFQQNFKIVFYRRQACDIYDCLYYLKESHRLDKVCSLFLGLKKILNL